MKPWNCPEGHTVSLRGNAPRGERFCPEHGLELRPAPQKKKQGLPGEQAAKARFRQVVTQERCFFADRDEMGDPRRPGHCCAYPLEAHHLIPKSWIKQAYSGLPPDELVALMWNPIIGAPLCRSAHHLITVHSDYIYRDELRLELIEFCEHFDAQHPNERSLLQRLYSESPERQADSA